MPEAVDYAKYPEHPLAGVAQEVLDAGRKATEGAAACNDLANGLAHPIADAVVLEIIKGGFRIISKTDLDMLLDAAWGDIYPSESEQAAFDRLRKEHRA